MAEIKKMKRAPWSYLGLAMAGCVVIGTGIGQLIGNVESGSMIGVGFGLLLMAYLMRESQ